MAKFVILAFLATVTLAESSGTLKITWEDCGDASTHGKVTDLEPTSIEIGAAATITGTGTVDETISGGTFELDMKASIISKTWTGNICEPKTFTIPLGLGTVKWDGMKCPISPGTTSVPLDVKMSSSIPASLATASISAKATATSGDRLLCMNVHLAKAVSAGTAVVTEAAGACSADDESFISAHAGNGADSFGKMSSDCGHDAFSVFHGFQEDKFKKCIMGKGLKTDACAGCYAKAGEFGVGNCKVACFSSWCSQKCLDCTGKNAATLDDCTGFPEATVSPCSSIDVTEGVVV